MCEMNLGPTCTFVTPFTGGQVSHDSRRLSHPLTSQRLKPVTWSMSLPQPSSRPSHHISRRAFLLSVLPAAAVTAATSPAFADHTLTAAKLSYDRYHPRILETIEKVRQIGQAVTTGNVEAAAKIIQDKVFQVKSRRAFKIYATSFSDNYLTQKSRKMIKAMDAFYSAMDQVAKGTEMKMHYNAAIDMLEVYYKIARLPPSEIASLRVQT